MYLFDIKYLFSTNQPIIHHPSPQFPQKKKNLGAALLSRVLLLLSSASLSLLFSLAINSININAENGGSAGQANTKKPPVKNPRNSCDR